MRRSASYVASAPALYARSSGGVAGGRGHCRDSVRGPRTGPAPDGAGSFWQLAVDPSHKGSGLGQRLLSLAEVRVAARGATQVVIDRSSQATDLVSWYLRRDYAPVGCDQLRQRGSLEGSADGLIVASGGGRLSAR
ncbi:GNAT family N-acetyltransferase [Streptomyces xanthophaeus]|uniref:GNAT family N-acetyltransferase n=1 Tax=Streptomyces xanthophaeus TaxID=67385 RepID=UPI00398FA6E2